MRRKGGLRRHLMIFDRPMSYTVRCLWRLGHLIITTSGIILSSVSASLPQWRREKWAYRRLSQNSNKRVIFIKGNGSQHAIIVQGCERFLDLEDLATGQKNLEVLPSKFTKGALWVFAFLWIILLITAAGLEENTWFLLAVGGHWNYIQYMDCWSLKTPKIKWYTGPRYKFYKLYEAMRRASVYHSWGPPEFNIKLKISLYFIRTPRVPRGVASITGEVIGV